MSERVLRTYECTGNAPEEVKIELGIASISFSGDLRQENFLPEELLSTTELRLKEKLKRSRPRRNLTLKMANGRMASHEAWGKDNHTRQDDSSPPPRAHHNNSPTPAPMEQTPPADDCMPIFDRVAPERIAVYETRDASPFTVAAQQIRDYILLDLEIRKYYNRERSDKPTTAIGYARFASLFNKSTGTTSDSPKLAYFDASRAFGDDVPVAGITSPSPTMEMLTVTLPDIVSGPIITPGHVQILDAEYRQLQAAKDAFARSQVNGMAKAQKAKAEKKMAAAAAERARNGIGGFKFSKHT
ncbi:hypothetical protein BT96DRAFT_943634 [Gymnopus androsaceus JB14]|uniref:Uncharacterized protein n=1 Tax=Gymnopus androsaceus JB14 TaxID=1447944 RepID=A0A6A4H7Y6_9AGAR|nr:hypothetical protein BT96DRAFT_943634 [Gymnopus androsaceus JB14]